VPSACRHPFADLLLEFFWWERRTCHVAVSIAEPTGSNDIRRIVAATFAPRFQMLGSSLEQKRPPF